MVFDFMDISSKVSLTRTIKRWLAEENNKTTIKSLVEQINAMLNITELNGDLLRYTLILVGLGVITPITQATIVGNKITFNMKSYLTLPTWATDSKYYSYLIGHVDMIMDCVEAMASKVVALLLPALEACLIQHNVDALPLYPKADPERDILLIRQYTKKGVRR